ncbi:hypothetical protein KP509_11G099400 [Ceratopteris richardii]|uniref:NB-ARC domain-containing protein n=1 Tax=Ceratopteris richardii TaxID=49495 RepID=A0A8T2TXR4_CERRI|nr:hypothetical protein KP509_11G099400 [Ceratopteris richardii]
MAVYYVEKDVHLSFISHLAETFLMHGLNVHLFAEEIVRTGIEMDIQHVQVVISIISQSFSVREFEAFLKDLNVQIRDIGHPKVMYISYGPHELTEINSTMSFSFRVDFQEPTGKLDKLEFKSLVNEVLQTFHEECNDRLEPTDFPVGLAKCCNEIQSRINTSLSRNHASNNVFGIVGMGGIGKTSIAKALYNKIHHKFEGSAFISNIKARATETRSGLVRLQEDIIKSVLASNYSEDTSFNNVDEGTSMLSRELMGINALIVLDDVHEKSHIETLCGPLYTMGPESVVILTSRYAEILEACVGSGENIIEIEGLDEGDSKRLFFWHAFRRPKPPRNLEGISKTVIDACHGLPVALKVIGTHLHSFSEHPQVWEESLSFLQENARDVFGIFRMNVDGLEEFQIYAFLNVCFFSSWQSDGSTYSVFKRTLRDAFLDVACFLVGKSKGTAIEVLDACYGRGEAHLEVLKNTGLISFDADDREQKVITMHEEILDMGRYIVQNYGEENRILWDARTDQEIPQDGRSISNLHALSIRDGDIFMRSMDVWKRLRQLKILLVQGGELSSWNRPQGISVRVMKYGMSFISHPLQGPSNIQWNELRWLAWTKVPFTDFPHELLCSTNLRVLDLPYASRLRCLIVKGLVMPNLRRLDLHMCENVEELPEIGTSMPSLQWISLMYCSSFKGFDGSIGKLQDLRSLDLSYCVHMEKLPRELEDVLSLQELNLKTCISLDTFDFFPKNLWKLNLSTCAKLRNLSAKIGTLSNLRALDISHCYRLSSLPIEIKDLSSLEELNLEACVSLETLDFFPRHLCKLNLRKCKRLKAVGADIGMLTNLRMLDISHCSCLASLPPQIENLASLQEPCP